MKCHRFADVQGVLSAVAKRKLFRTYPSYVLSSNYSYRYSLGKLAIFCFITNIRQFAEYSAILPNIYPKLALKFMDFEVIYV